jgi:hypothetical protein
MKFRLLLLIVFLLVCGVAVAQDAFPPQDNGSGRGMGRGGMGMGNGFIGTVTAAAADHFLVKSESGEVYTVHFSVNTRFFKQPAGMRGGGPARADGGGQSGGDGPRPGGGMGRGGESIKSTDIKIGDAVGAMGEVDAKAKSVGAVAIVQLDPERARQMEKMQANYGKTWLMGKVTAIDGVKVTIAGSVDNQPHDFVADENTTFRKRRDPVTLADIQVGDTVRAEGAVSKGVFTATTVNVMGMPPAGAPGMPPGRPPQ